jgi:ABC-type nitrate/sulfonate/bicarbonate transport system substrate-binding protein
MKNSSAECRSGDKNRALQIGFVPATDCAPLVYAQESGLFQKYELDVELHRETRWANICDKVVYGELDAAHAPATLPFVANFGLSSDSAACIAGMVMSLQGDAIVISRELWNEGVRDAATLRGLVYRHWGRRTCTFAVVFPHSPAYFVLRQWLKLGGVAAHTEIRIVSLPPAQMFPMLKLGYIDGFCCGEPWTSLAMEAAGGACVAASGELAPLHPEKVLMVRRDFADHRAEQHERLIAALLEACAFCDQQKNQEMLADMLARPEYVNAPADCFRNGLARCANFSSRNLFHAYNANEPTDEKAAWIVEGLYELIEQNVLKPSGERAPVLKNVFRRDIFHRAKTVGYDQDRATSADVDAYAPVPVRAFKA